MTQAYNLTKLKSRRRELRKNEPFTERTLWSKLRNRQIKGFKFKRQFSLGNFIIDFYCPEIKLAIEVDGDSHYQADAKIKDSTRQKYIESFGVRFLRFTNLDISRNLEGVLEVISQNLP